jgi:hypothetical protein
MSFVPDFELADDGKWYQHAVIGEPKKWYVCFDDEQPPELLIRRLRGDRFETTEVYMPVDKLLAAFKLPLAVVQRRANVHCMFPDVTGRFCGKLLHAESYEVRLTGSLPSRLIISFTDVFPERPVVEGVYYG